MAPPGSDTLWFDVHHDGYFEGNPLRYEDGLVYEWKLYKSKKMGYKSMWKFLNDKTNHLGKPGLYFCLPGCQLELGLEILESDSDVDSMYTFAESYGKLQVFMTHRHQDLYEYYFKNLNIEESEDEATSRLSIHKIMVKDASNISVDELISWAEEDSETRTPKKIAVEPVEEDVDIPIVNLVNSPVLKNKLLGRTSPSPSTKRRLLDNHKSPTSYVVNKGRSGDNGTGSSPSPMVNETTDKGKGIMVEDTNTVKKAVDKGKGIMVEDVRPKKLPVCRNNGIVIQENVEPSVMESDSSSESESDPANGINFSLYSGSDSESGWYSDKSVNYLSISCSRDKGRKVSHT